MSEIETIVEQFTEIKETVRKRGKELLGQYIKSLFAELPASVTAIRWRQYAPHFNDGDPCTFSVHDRYFKTAGTDDDGGDYDDGFDYADSAEENACNEKLGAIPDEFYEMAFGDGVMVTATRDENGGVSIEIDDYDHD